MLARHRRVRPWRAAAYFLLAAGGIVIWMDPFRQLDDVPFVLRWVWTGFVVVGGLGSMLGAITDEWIYEFVALPLVIVGFAGFAVVLGAGGGNTARWAFACWLTALIVDPPARRYVGLWKFVAALRRARRREADGA